MTNIEPRVRAIKGRAYAKVNLTLEVLERRTDGYHNLRSVMMPVRMWDTIRIRVDEPGLRVACQDASKQPLPDLPIDEENLAGQAALSFFGALGVPAAANVRITKGIPAQAGLGGGGSDAACTLALLNRAWGDPLPPDALSDLAAGLGSDVPFFLAGGCAVVEGRGEQVTRIPCARQVWLLVIKPAISVSTAWAYAQWSKSPHPPAQDRTPKMLAALRSRSVESLAAALHNDLQSVVVPRNDELEACLSGLRFAGARGRLLCGSGSAVFGLVDSAAHCRAVLDRMPMGEHPRSLWTTSRAPGGYEILNELV